MPSRRRELFRLGAACWAAGVVFAGLGLAGAKAEPPGHATLTGAPGLSEHRLRAASSDILDRIGGSAPDVQAQGHQSAPGTADVGRAVVLIRSRACGALAAGSGVVVAGGRLVTARHVVEGSPLVEAGGHTGVATQLDPVADAAVIGDLSQMPAPLPLATHDLRSGAAVTIIGWASGFRESTVTGRVAMVRHPGELGEGAPVVAITADGVVPGFSGGALIDARGQLAGIVTAIESPTGLVLAVPASRLRHLLLTAAPGPATEPSANAGVARCPR